ncbi:MAG: bacillithiol biosynthesis BshC [Planctomycetota bacterium]|nr:bacillithiol biosynthesis BshC [Planctomycetota bacterium]
MSPSVRHIPIRHMGSSPAHLRYLEEDPDLKPFLGQRPRDTADLLRRAPASARRLVNPQALSEALIAYATRHEAPAEVLANAESMASGEVHVVVTGQQPGLFGGPLYTVHKAATAVRLAQELNALDSGPRVVPVFWNHTDDHDLDEVNRAFFVNNNLEVQRVRLDLSRGGEPIRDIGIGHKIEQVLATVGDLLPHNEFRSWAMETFSPREPNDHFGDGLARLLFRLFGKFGLLVIEPRDLPVEAFEVLPRWWEQAPMIRDSIRSTIEVLLDLGLDLGMDPAGTLMFEVHGNRRVPMAEGDPVQHAGDLSPGAVLRPLWQDACLPTVASVVGPGELSYLSVAGPLYQRLGVPSPVLVPRASMTLVEPSLSKLLTRFGWDISDLELGPDRLAERTLDGEGGGEESRLETLGSNLDQGLTELIQSVRTSDPQMIRGVERTKKKVLEELGKLLSKLRNSRQNREGTGTRQIRRIANNLRPRGRPQERMLTVLPFLAAHGPELGDYLVGAADPFTTNHAILEL